MKTFEQWCDEQGWPSSGNGQARLMRVVWNAACEKKDAEIAYWRRLADKRIKALSAASTEIAELRGMLEKCHRALGYLNPEFELAKELTAKLEQLKGTEHVQNSDTSKQARQTGGGK